MGANEIDASFRRILEAPAQRLPVEQLADTKVCRNCAHWREGDFCGAAPRSNVVTGERGYWSCGTERDYGTCKHAAKFIPNESTEARASARRIEVQRAIEDSISTGAIDGVAASEILDALKAAVERNCDFLSPNACEAFETLRAEFAEMQR